MENKVYIKPVVEAVPVQMSSIVMAGSTKGIVISGDPISSGVGG